MHRRFALVFLAAAGPLMVGAMIWDQPFARVVFAVLTALMPVALIMISIEPGRARPILSRVLIVMGLLLLSATLAVLSNTSLGVGTRALIMFAGLGLVPLPFVIWGFAADFERGFVDADLLARLRRLSLGKKGE